MYKKHEALEHKLCKELDTLEEKYRSANDLSEGDLRRIEMITHSLKSLIWYDNEKEKEDAYAANNSYNSYDNSYNRSMGPMNSNMNSMNGMNNMNSMNNMRYGYSGDHFPYRPNEYPDPRNNW